MRLIQGLAVALSALSLLSFTSCNQDSSISSEEARRLEFNLSDISLSTRSLSSVFEDGDITRFKWATASDWATFKSSSLSSTELQYSGSSVTSLDEIWLKKSSSILGICVPDSFTLSTLGECPQFTLNSNFDAQSGIQSWYSGLTSASFTSPVISTQLYPAFNEYVFESVNLTSINKQYSVAITEAVVEYSYPWYPRWSIVSGEPVVEYSSNSCGTYKSKSEMLTWYPDVPAAFGTVDVRVEDGAPSIFVPAVVAATVHLKFNLVDSEGKVAATHQKDVVLDLKKFNSDFTSYHFTLSGKVDAGGGPVGFNLTAKELSVVDQALSAGTISVE